MSVHHDDSQVTIDIADHFNGNTKGAPRSDPSNPLLYAQTGTRLQAERFQMVVDSFGIVGMNRCGSDSWFTRGKSRGRDLTFAIRQEIDRIGSIFSPLIDDPVVCELPQFTTIVKEGIWRQSAVEYARPSIPHDVSILHLLFSVE